MGANQPKALRTCLLGNDACWLLWAYNCSASVVLYDTPLNSPTGGVGIMDAIEPSRPERTIERPLTHIPTVWSQSSRKLGLSSRWCVQETLIISRFRANLFKKDNFQNILFLNNSHIHIEISLNIDLIFPWFEVSNFQLKYDGSQNWKENVKIKTKNHK